MPLQNTTRYPHAFIYTFPPLYAKEPAAKQALLFYICPFAKHS